MLARHVWIVYDSQLEPCALVDVESYDDGTAGMALVVAPGRRGQGWANRCWPRWMVCQS